MAGIVFQRTIIVKRCGNGCEITLIELLEKNRGHGLRIVISPSSKVEIYGFGNGFPSHINMFQSDGVWHWATIENKSIEKFVKMPVNSCEDVAKTVYTIVSMSRDPILMMFAEKFVRKYSMHGRVHCIDIGYVNL
ncbi:MAG: hypothetical protein LM572_03250 [Ignisphaera sp.]|nr:hypothetical protein [Ignisphaera sp.]MCC6056069.1 hypothetical protein [Desulfurococcaceae archaeon]